MPCGIIPSGRAPKSIVVTLTCIDLPTAKGWQNRRFFNVLPKRARQKNKRVCSCTTTVYVNLSMNSFIMPTVFCSRKRMQNYILFHFPQNNSQENIHFNLLFNICKRFKNLKNTHTPYIYRAGHSQKEQYFSLSAE